MSAFDDLQKCSFRAISFPVEEITISGGLRDAVHEYPYVDGGAPEKLGRRLYTISLRANFHATLKAYPDLWPAGLAQLRYLFENQVTASLVIPTLGTIQAYCQNWTQTASSRMLSGESMSLTFREDASASHLVDAIVKAGKSTVADAAKAFQIKADAVQPKPSIFADIRRGVNKILAIRDQAELAGNMLESKVLAVDSLLREADRTVDALKHPGNLPLILAFRALWRSIRALSKTLDPRPEQPLVEYTTPRPMTAHDVSMAVFGDTSGIADILRAVGPAIGKGGYDIPAGTKVKFPRGSGKRLP